MMLIMTGVASTAIRPEPTNGAVCSGATTSSDVPRSPGAIWARTGLIRALEGMVLEGMVLEGMVLEGNGEEAVFRVRECCPSPGIMS
jgi:hypothetical protein